jgi:hypothetical protein
VVSQPGFPGFSVTGPLSRENTGFELNRAGSMAGLPLVSGNLHIVSQPHFPYLENTLFLGLLRVHAELVYGKHLKQ